LAEVIVSDNSETDSIQRLVATEYPGIKYIRRIPTLASPQHFRTVIEEASAEYLVIFHDDDVMMPSYARVMLQALDSNLALAAVGCNALLMRDRSKTNKSAMGAVSSPVLIDTAIKFLHPYLAFSLCLPAPFPGYMYRRRYLEGLYLDWEHGGKHSDVSFLSKVLKRGLILWLPQPLMWYRMHEQSGSSIESIGDRLSLLRYLAAEHGIDLKSSAVREYKFRYLLRWWLQQHGTSFPIRISNWRDRIVFRLLFLTAFRFAVTKPIIWQKLLQKIFRK